ncbi:MAG: TraX family protein [Peptoniphilaceae bacterium]
MIKDIINRAKAKGISGSTLKIIALISMFLDHIGGGILKEFKIIFKNSNFINDLNLLYIFLRGIGRIAFPLYMYLLIVGYKKTRNVKKYFIRLLLFGLISEIPFDLLFFGEILEFTHQNIFFELAMIILLFMFIDKVQSFLMKIFITLLIGFIAQALNLDYGVFGIIAALIMYLNYGDRKKEAISIVPAFFFEINYPTIFIPAILVYFYNGKRGINLKYLFYTFYPLHLLILYLLKIYLT